MKYKYKVNGLDVLLNIINKLPEQQRKILLLRHFEDKSTDEIETETGLSNANIRVKRQLSDWL